MMCNYVPNGFLSEAEPGRSNAQKTSQLKAPVPVAPDTLWSGHPFIAIDPLIIVKKLDVYAIGYKPRFQVTTCLVKDRKRRFRVP